MMILLLGIVVGLVAQTLTQLLLAATTCAVLLYAVPRIGRSLRDIRSTRSMSSEDEAAAIRAGIDVAAAKRLTPRYAITYYAVVGIIGTNAVALVVMGVKALM